MEAIFSFIFFAASAPKKDRIKRKYMRIESKKENENE
jgi:hypothetical protein